MSASEHLRRARPLLGTFVEIETDGGRELLEAAFAVIARVERLMSFHRPDSDVAKINARATDGPVRVHAWTFDVLAKARLLWERSAGAFDVTREGRFAAITWSDSREVMASRPVTLDLGGIAKGWAVDRAIALLRAGGARSAVVNAGGDLRVWGEREIAVTMRDPATGRPTAALPLRQAALATTAVYAPWSGRSPQDGVRSAGRVAAVPPWQSVSVRAPRCWQADALTKVAWLRGGCARPLLRGYRAEALWVQADGSTSQTGGWR